MDQISWGSLLSDTYDLLWKSIIRPPRSQYKLSDLGPTKFRMGSQVYTREDFQLLNARDMKLSCSLFRVFPKRHQSPCVIYLHGNCSSRIEAMDVLQVVLSRDMMLCCLDLSGSGHSEGEFISLGHFEEQDLKVLIQHLRSLGVTYLGLWGRSMGAATSILRAAEDWSIGAIVLDSPFSSLPVVAQELVNSKIPIPEFMMNMALSRVRREILERANFDIEDLLPIRSAARARSPALFATAEDDDFILPHHTYDIHRAWGSEMTKLVTFDGGHNGVRPKWFLEEGAEFLATRLKDPLSSVLPTPGTPASAQKPHKETQPPSPPRSLTKKAPGASGLQKCDEVTSQLVAMGFSQDIAEEAAAQFSSAEEAVEWTLKHSTQMAKETAEALDSVAKKLRAPEPVTRERLKAVSPEVEAATAAAGRALRELAEFQVGLRSTSNPQSGEGYGDGGQLMKQLLELGFPSTVAKQAANQCSSVESAVSWLAENGKLC